MEGKKVFMGVAQIMLDDLDLSNIVIGWYKLFGTSSLVSLPPGGPGGAPAGQPAGPGGASPGGGGGGSAGTVPAVPGPGAVKKGSMQSLDSFG